MGRIQILRVHHGVDFVQGDARVKVDTRGHTLKLEDHRGEHLELGALRASLLTAISFVARAFEVDYAGRDFSPVPAALEEALKRLAQERGVLDPALEARVAAVVPTPLIFSAPFLEARYVWQDALRFRACCIAIARVEDDLLEEDSPEAAACIVERLGRWRDLFAPSGKSKRALNVALHDFGEALDADALWGLRKVELTRPRSQRAHLELLGNLGALGQALGHHKDFARIIALVEAANDGDVDAALGGALDARHSAPLEPRALAWLLAQGEPSSATLLQLFRSALDATSRSSQAYAAFPPPPIAPPQLEGIRWIADGRALHDEGQRMHHCVFSLVSACKKRKAFVFHVEREGSHGTVHLDGEGHIVEYRGPFNRRSLAADWGAQVLEEWGKDLWFGAVDRDRLIWPKGLPAPVDGRPLRSLGAIVDAYRAIIARRPEDKVRLRDWVRAAAESAAAGGVGLYTREGDPDRIYVRTIDGYDLGHSDVADAPRTKLQLNRVCVMHAPQNPIRLMPEPPIPPPQRLDLMLLRTELELRSIGLKPNELNVVSNRAASGSHFYLRCTLAARTGASEEVVFVESDRGGVLRVVGRQPTTELRRAEALSLARRWTGGLWAAHLGLETSAWVGERRVPMGGEALKTVGACFLVFRGTCERRADLNGALERFYRTHVHAAVAGRAWLVSRDRAAGLVSVLDHRGQVIARTEDVLGPGGVGDGGGAHERPREPVRTRPRA